ncbi:MAG: methionyl-tRNA formyltransferase [Candidatus Melainabacteria bacterium GWF2_37_15]|nr:MAG: methionyl-tRNA formyltransferase [Candidatus Melainabacteria bacterium GWF2_37_15]
MKIIFLGTPQIAVKSLECLINKDDVEVVAVITQPDKPAGRGKHLCAPPIKQKAQEYNIPVYQPVSIRKDLELISILKELKPDFFVTFAFGQILSQEVIDIPKYGCINLHASLLPKYRGANPIQSAIINGEKKTGITTMLTELSLDTGPIVLQEEIELTDSMVTGDLCGIIAQRSPELIYKSLKGLKDGIIVPTPQDSNQATYTPKLKKEDGLIDWAESAQSIHNKVRGLKPWPEAFTYIKNTCIKITETKLNSEKIIKSGAVGEILCKIKDGILVQTGEDSIIVTRVQPACKKEQDAVSWYNGARLQEGEGFKGG